MEQYRKLEEVTERKAGDGASQCASKQRYRKLFIAAKWVI